MLADSCFSDMIEIGKGNRNINEEVFIVGGYDHGNESWNELRCAKLMEQCLVEGKGSVGMSVEVKHLASTPCGMKVRCEAEITEVVNGKKVTFAVNAYDENGLIGTGTHKRAVINKAAFNM